MSPTEVAPRTDDAAVRIGLVGCGNISQRYVDGLRRFAELDLVGCADLDPALAATLAGANAIRAYATVEDLLGDAAIDVVVNITPPRAHEQVSLQVVEAGKHLYVEKPICTSVAAARRVVEAAAARGVLVGAAPDTFLGSAGQTARAAIDAGRIGEPIGVAAFIRYSRAEEWHPDPTFLFQPGGGPSLDLGPYFVTALVNLLGPVEAVHAFSRIGARTRPVTAPVRRVDEVTVTVPTHTSASLRFANGTIGTLISSFDIWDTDLPFIEVYGTQGVLQLGDANEYDSPVRVKRHDAPDWVVEEPVVEVTGEPGTPVQLLRGIGVQDLARAVRGQDVSRASADLAVHVLDVIESLETSDATGATVTISSAPARPAARTRDLDPVAG